MPEERTGAEGLDGGEVDRRDGRDERGLGVAVAGLDEERRQPGQERDDDGGVREQLVARGLTVRPKRPRRLRREDERRDVVAVHGRGGGDDVERPPSKPALLEGEEQRQGREDDQRGDQGVGAGPGRVVDLERADREPGRGHRRGRAPHGAPPEQVHQRHARDARYEGGNPQRNRQLVAAREQPRQHEPQRRRLLRVVHDRQDVPERVVLDDRVQEQLVVVEADLKRRPPQDDRHHRERADDQPLRTWRPERNRRGAQEAVRREGPGVRRRVRQRFSATRGASRANVHTPSTQIAT